MQTKEGGRKVVAAMVAKYGSYEAWIEYLRANGRKGGAKSRGGGFASTKVGKDGLTGQQRARIHGAKGGQVSRRGPVAK